MKTFDHPCSLLQTNIHPKAMQSDLPIVTVVGAGLAGSECAFQLAQAGFKVRLIECRPEKKSPAHKTEHFAELVCSNSFGSQTDYSAPGQLKWEARALGSLILACAEKSQIPAGMALGVDREVFGSLVSSLVKRHPNIEVVHRLIESLDEVPRPAVIATGPLTFDSLSMDMQKHFGNDFLYFFDAIAPIIEADSIDRDICFKASRFDDGEGDYLNCPLDKAQYFALIEAIKAAKKIEPKEFETKTPYFESCMPVEAIVERGDRTLRFGPMSPKGLIDPRTGKIAYATVQLRQENVAGTAYNMVGFQTKMSYADQPRVFRMIPGLENAEFLKLGSMHRNLYIHSPSKLNPDLSSRNDSDLYFAGQITGVEGYFESTCIGLLVARFISQKYAKASTQRQVAHPPGSFGWMKPPPRESAFGSLLNALTEDKKHFQPTNINFGLLPPLPDEGVGHKTPKDQKRKMMLDRAKASFRTWTLPQPLDSNFLSL